MKLRLDRVLRLSWVLACCLLVAGCEKPQTNAASSVAVQDGPTKAQPKLPTIKLWMGDQEMITEMARTENQVQTGMMFRKDMAENEGMIFIFGRAHQASFYMRNTYIPLSCAYIDNDGVILEIRDMKPLDESSILARTDRVRFVLETRQGWFDRHHISTGMVIRSEKGPLLTTFFPRQ